MYSHGTWLCMVTPGSVWKLKDHAYFTVVQNKKGTVYREIFEWCKFSYISHEAWQYKKKNLTCKISNFEGAILTCGSAMALYQFRPLDGLPDPSGPLSASVSPAAIKDAIEAVRNVTQSKPRGNMPSSHPSSRQRLASMPHWTANRQLFIIFQRSWESRWRLLWFRLGKYLAEEGVVMCRHIWK